MLPVGTRYESARTGGWLQIVERTDARMSFERLLKPGTGRAGPHFHLDFTQTWEAASGSGSIQVEGEQRPLTAGHGVVLEPGTKHRDPWNPGEGELVIRGTFTPCTEFIEAYAEALVHHLREGTANDQDEMPLLQIVALAAKTDGQSFRPGIPVALQRASGPLAVVLARLRGYPTRFGDEAG